MLVFVFSQDPCFSGLSEVVADKKRRITVDRLQRELEEASRLRTRMDNNEQ